MKIPDPNEKSVDILLLPVSGPVGYGEFARCKMIAQASRERWPELSVKLAVSRAARFVDDVALDIAPLAASPTKDLEGVAALLADFRPRLVIFDNGGRASQLRLARAFGSTTAYISSRPRSRRRAFSVRRMRNLDEAWLVGDPISQSRTVTLRERLASRIFPATRHHFMGPVFPTPQAAPNPAAERVGGEYALFVPGGGATGGSDVGALYLNAAEHYVRATGQEAVVICGPGIDVPQRERAVPVIPFLPPQAFANALAGCTLAVTGGGAVVSQALAMDKPVVAAPLGGSDQGARVRNLAAAGVLLAAGAQADELAQQAIRLRRDADLAAACAKARRALQLEPGLPRVLDRIAELLGLPS
ncbi:hypothetical protein [Wenzhouxiangella sediminis]|uniref:Glycosyl transferase family 28 C-terminal domain-containing protein n=1 Tax=Wenzhouxiangella sediminis TaxID=1792836 RepID=A0A3E1KCB4_9GAMM|nr:hypothetical protein [Wenzhouxiangella sediminis]RFF31764.1 hypothetical protein DZC52_03705 [Wenzhouxiangella sediminis]